MIKRILKIVGITMGSIIALTLLLITLTIWIIFTPQRLTPIVRNVASEYIICDHTIGQVELTFFSTFPNFGLEMDSVYIINSMDGAPSDTVLAAPKMVLSMNLIDLFQKNTLTIHTLSAPTIQANIYTAADGSTNYDVFNIPSDSTKIEELPFEQIVIEELLLSATSLQYINVPDSLDIALHNATIEAQVAGWNDILLTLNIPSVNATIASEEVATGLNIQVVAPTALDLKNSYIALNDAHVSVNGLDIALNGWASMGDAIQTDLRVTLNEWEIDSILPLLPFSIDQEATQLAQNGIISLDVNAKIDMAKNNPSALTIHNFTANLQNSTIQITGDVQDLLGNCWIDLSTNINIPTKNVKRFLPEGLQLTGQINSSANVQMYLNDLMAKEWQKSKISGEVSLTGINYQNEEMIASLQNSQIAFQIPNINPSHTNTDWLNMTLHVEKGEMDMQGIQADLGNTNISVETNCFLDDPTYLYANVAFLCNQKLSAAMDSYANMAISRPNVQAYVAYHLKDADVLPTVDAKVGFDQIYGNFAGTKVDIQPTTLTALVQFPHIEAALHTNALMVQMGDDMKVQTQQIALEVAADNNDNENPIMALNPSVSIDLQHAEIETIELKHKITIPKFDIAYANESCKVHQADFKIGESDFSLTGKLENIVNWMLNGEALAGDLNFNSHHTNVNKILALFSADCGAEEEDEWGYFEESDDDEGPFLVPTNIDLALNTHIDTATAFNQQVNDLTGNVFIKNGVLILEEMGFTCEAAKLQLTGMYHTPRRNHIYAGFDYHMMDINIEELIKMIPQLDSIMPMLSSFKGDAELHIAGETYLNEHYDIKPSTLRGALSVHGKDLVILDNEAFSKISKLLLFDKKTENKVDSISAEMTLYKGEIDIYPFCVSMDNYLVALGGTHNLDMTFNYDINVLSPIYLGVNVSGAIDNLDIKLAPCKFAKDFKPLFHKKVDTQSAELRSMIRESMRKNVKSH